MEDFGDIPVGLTLFDSWMTKIAILHICGGLIDVEDFFSMDRGHWKHYYESGYSPEMAFREDLTCYGE